MQMQTRNLAIPPKIKQRGRVLAKTYEMKKGGQSERREGPFIHFQGPKLLSSYLSLLLC